MSIFARPIRLWRTLVMPGRWHCADGHCFVATDVEYKRRGARCPDCGQPAHTGMRSDCAECSVLRATRMAR